MNLSDSNQNLYNIVEIDERSGFDYNDNYQTLNFQHECFHEHENICQQKPYLPTDDHPQRQKYTEDVKQVLQYRQENFQKLNQRRIRKIQVNDRKLQQIDKIKKGQGDETNCLNKNLHTETKKFLKKMVRLRCVDSKEITIIRQYINKGASFKNTQTLYSMPSLRKKCLQYYSQTSFLKNILISQHMSLKNKTMMLKYLGRLHLNAGSQKMRWKDSFGSL